MQPEKTGLSEWTATNLFAFKYSGILPDNKKGILSTSISSALETSLLTKLEASLSVKRISAPNVPSSTVKSIITGEGCFSAKAQIA